MHLLATAGSLDAYEVSDSEDEFIKELESIFEAEQETHANKEEVPLLSDHELMVD